MVRDSQILAATTAFARAVCEHIGVGKPLGTVEVADDTAVSDEQVRRICKGTATPDLEWCARFTVAFGDRFAAVVDGAWNAYFAALGRRVARIDAGGTAFLDANGDGRHDTTDSVLHAGEIGRLECEYQRDALRGAPQEKLQANRAEMQRHVDALCKLAELAWKTSYPRSARATG